MNRRSIYLLLCNCTMFRSNHHTVAGGFPQGFLYAGLCAVCIAHGDVFGREVTGIILPECGKGSLLQPLKEAGHGILLSGTYQRPVHGPAVRLGIQQGAESTVRPVLSITAQRPLSMVDRSKGLRLFCGDEFSVFPMKKKSVRPLLKRAIVALFGRVTAQGEELLMNVEVLNAINPCLRVQGTLHQPYVC